MVIANLEALPFEEKVRMLPEKEQSYLQGYVDRALVSYKSKPVGLSDHSRKHPEKHVK